MVPEWPFGGADLGVFLSEPEAATAAAAAGFSLVTAPLSSEWGWEWVEPAMEGGDPDSLVGCEARVVEEVMVELAAVPVAMSVVEAMEVGRRWRWPRRVHRVHPVISAMVLGSLSGQEVHKQRDGTRTRCLCGVGSLPMTVGARPLGIRWKVVVVVVVVVGVVVVEE
jgi:hypothetical protein